MKKVKKIETFQCLRCRKQKPASKGVLLKYEVFNKKSGLKYHNQGLCNHCANAVYVSIENFADPWLEHGGI